MQVQPTGAIFVFDMPMRGAGSASIPSLLPGWQPNTRARACMHGPAAWLAAKRLHACMHASRRACTHANKKVYHDMYPTIHDAKRCCAHTSEQGRRLGSRVPWGHRAKGRNALVQASHRGRPQVAALAIHSNPRWWQNRCECSHRSLMAKQARVRLLQTQMQQHGRRMLCQTACYQSLR